MTKARPRRIPSVYPGGIDNLRDDQLLDAVRTGDTDAFGVLYARHAAQARRVAAQLADSQADGEDATSAAFLALLEQLLAGHGPTLSFWPDLLARLHHATSQSRAELRFTDREEIQDACLSDALLDSVRRQRERDVTRQAYACLSGRTQKLLRCLVIQGMSVDAVAASLRTEPKLVTKAATVATESLRVAYLRAHVPPPLSPGCVQPAGRLAAWLCGHLSAQPAQQVSRHVADCMPCAQAADRLARLRGRMRR
jgi:DNA-directed RNA polymerase specialized sigma24 family protein